MRRESIGSIGKSYVLIKKEVEQVLEISKLST